MCVLFGGDRSEMLFGVAWLDARRPVAVAAGVDGDVGQWIVGFSDGIVKVIERHSGEIHHILAEHTDEITRLAIFGEGTVVSASLDGSLRLWDTVSGSCTARFNGHSEAVYCCEVSVVKQLVVSGSADTMLKVWSADGECSATLFGHTAEVYCVSASFTSLSHSLRSFPCYRVCSRNF
jgi:WD40 repeat protein